MGRWLYALAGYLRSSFDFEESLAANGSLGSSSKRSVPELEQGKTCVEKKL